MLSHSESNGGKQTQIGIYGLDGWCTQTRDMRAKRGMREPDGDIKVRREYESQTMDMKARRADGDMRARRAYLIQTRN